MSTPHRSRALRGAALLALGASALTAVVAALAAGPAPGPASAPSAAADRVALNRLARTQAQAGDAAGLHETLLALQPLMPGSPRIAYNLAATAARTGHADEALARLAGLADAGLRYELDADADFAGLAGRDDFRAVRDRLHRNGAAIGASRRLAVLSVPDAIPESLAWDDATRRLFLASVRRCEIRVMDDPRRRWARDRPFARLPASVFALAVDAPRKRLWATIAVVAQGDGCGATPKALERTALLALDLRTGRVLQRIEAGVPGVLGDMLVTADGTVFVSESLHGALLRLRPGGTTLERLDPPGEFVSPQTPALAADGRTLLVPDYVRGIAAIDLDAPTAAPRWLANGAGVFSAGIDGLVREGDGFIAVQNGSAPARVLWLAADLSRQQVLESGTPGLGEPTHAIVVGRSVWFVSDVGWDRFDEDGRPRAGMAPARPELRSIERPR